MAEAGTLSYKLQIDKGTFESDLKSASSSVQNVKNKADEASSSADKIGDSSSTSADKIISILGGTAVLGAIAGLTDKFIEAVNASAKFGDEIDKMSIRLGMSTDEYQQWSTIFSYSDLDLSSSVRAFNNFFTAVSGGSADAVAALEELGISFEDLNGMSTSDQLLTIVDAFQQLNASGVDVRSLAQTMFGSTYGSQFMTLLTGSGIRNMFAETSALTASGESTSAAAQFNDALTTFNTLIAAIQLDALAPALSAFADALNSAIDWLLVITGRKKYDTDSEYYEGTEGLSMSDDTTFTARGMYNNLTQRFGQQVMSQDGYSQVSAALTAFFAAASKAYGSENDLSTLYQLVTGGFDLSTIGGIIQGKYANDDWWTATYERDEEAYAAYDYLMKTINKYATTGDAANNGLDDSSMTSAVAAGVAQGFSGISVNIDGTAIGNIVSRQIAQGM